MTEYKKLQSCQYGISDSGEEGVTVHIQGSMDESNATPLINELSAFVKKKHPSSLTVDMEKVTFLNDFGALALVEVKKLMTRGRGVFRLINVNENVEKVLSVLSFDVLGERSAISKSATPGAFVRLGDATLRQASDLKYMISFIGSVCIAMAQVIRHPGSLRTDDTFSYMQKTGVDALPIVGLISFLLGLIMAFMSAVQLEQFGANIYVASLVALAMTRELGPIMTCIIVAGRSGSAFAAEIGTMKVSEEVDALFTMGFEPTRYLVVPKIIASVTMVPLLVLFSDIFAIFGGLVVGVGMLDLTVNSYVAQTIKTLTLFDVFLGFIKGAVFALLIAWVGCLRGFQVRGGAASVGQATTSAVVSSIFLIIMTNSIFSVILRYWG